MKNTVQYKKKEYKKAARLAQEPITHVVFVKEDGKWVSTSNPIRCADVQRILRLSQVAANLPASLAVLIINDTDDVLYTLTGKVNNRAQFDLFMKEALAAKAKADVAKVKEPVDA